MSDTFNFPELILNLKAVDQRTLKSAFFRYGADGTITPFTEWTNQTVASFLYGAYANILLDIDELMFTHQNNKRLKNPLNSVRNTRHTMLREQTGMLWLTNKPVSNVGGYELSLESISALRTYDRLEKQLSTARNKLNKFLMP